MFFPTNSNWSGTLDLILHEGFSWKNLLRHFLFLFTKTVDKKALSQIFLSNFSKHRNQSQNFLAISLSLFSPLLQSNKAKPV